MFFVGSDIPPNFVETFTETKVLEKQNLTLICKVTGKPEPTVKWFQDDTEIKPTFKNKITKDKETCTLLITGFTAKMAGVYKCVATNKAGTATHEAPVTVQGSFTIVSVSLCVVLN